MAQDILGCTGVTGNAWHTGLTRGQDIVRCAWNQEVHRSQYITQDVLG